MTGVILAAGKGTRLGDLTSNLPKSLLKLNNEITLLDYNLNILDKLNIEHIIIITGYKSSMIEEHVAHKKNIQCLFNPFWNHCNVLGSFYFALPYIKDDFFFLHADSLVDFNVWERLKKKMAQSYFHLRKKNVGKKK